MMQKSPGGMPEGQGGACMMQEFRGEWPQAEGVHR
jgi:hypothetical protein